MQKLLFSFLVTGGLLVAIGTVHADEITTSTDSIISEPQIPTTTIDIPTSTPEAPTSTIDIPTTTPEMPTSTTDIPTTTPETPTSTPTVPTSTPEIPTSTPETPTPTSTPTSTPETGDTTSGDHTPPPTPILDSEIQSAVQKILDFLQSKQNGNGKILDIGTSDWAAMTFGANGIYSNEIQTSTTSLLYYLYNTNITDELNLCAAYPRHVLGLLSAGVSTNDTKITELKTQIKSQCDKNNGFGPDSEINDDIFGLVALTALGESVNNNFIQNTITSILSNQQPDGSFTSYGWAGADITGAAMSALQYAKNNGANIDGNTLTRAKNYLKSTQLADGGWGWGVSDALNTSWALMGINALGETQADWFNSNGKNPWHVLLENLNNQGHYTSVWSADGIDWFGTKHSVPALLGKSWPIILAPKTPTNNTIGTGDASLQIATTTPIATTTTVVSTTIEMTTTSTITTELTTPSSTPTSSLAQNELVISSRDTVLTTKTKKVIAITTTPIKATASTDKNLTESANTQSDYTNLNQKMIESFPLDTPTKNTAKKALAVTGGSTIAMGLYLGLKLIKSMI